MTRSEQRNRAARRVVNMRGWPGLDGWRPPGAPAAYTPRLGDRPALVLVMASEVGVTPERYGLGAFLVVIGRSVLDAGVIVPDDLTAGARTEVEHWTKHHRIETSGGRRRWRVTMLSEFFDPRTGPFVQNAYSGCGWVIGADLGRIFGLTAEHVVERTGNGRGSWEVWPPGWGIDGEKGRISRTSPHRPPLRCTPRRVGWQVEFGPCEKRCGKYVGDHQWRGAFVDVLSLAYALDADRGGSFAEHREDLGLGPVELPISVSRDVLGACRMADAVVAVHELAIELDATAPNWFTTAGDRAEERGRLDLARTVSPGGIAAGLLLRAGVRTPIETFRLSGEEHAHWCESFHGGLCGAEPELIRRPFEAASLDVGSDFPLVAHLIEWWRLVTAERIGRRDVTVKLQAICEGAASDPTVALDPKVWRDFGCCLVEIIADGEILPIEIEDERRPDGRLENVPVFSPDRPLWCSALGVIASAVTSNRAPEIRSATAYVPQGCQSKIRRQLSVLPGLVLDTKDDDPAVALVRHRRAAKAAGDLTQAALLRVVVNSLVYGGFARFDETLVKSGRTWARGERPGPWNVMALASSVTAGSHLLLALLDRLVRDKGGRVAYWDTDSSIVPASIDGGELMLSGGTAIRQLSLHEVAQVVDAFAPLSPEPGWLVWGGIENGTAQVVTFGPKRHAALSGDELVEMTEAGIGGVFADPPAVRGRTSQGYRRWSGAAVRREVDYALARQFDPEALRPGAPWDTGSALPFPALRRFQVRHPVQLRSLPAGLGAQPGTRFLRVSGSELAAPGRTFVALDPGGDLAEWQMLTWLDTQTAERVRLTTDFMDIDAHVVETLAERAVRYSDPPRSELIAEVVVDPNLITHRGRVSGVIDADADGLNDIGSFRPVHQEAEATAAVVREVRRIGPKAFSERYNVSVSTAQKISAGRQPSARIVARIIGLMRRGVTEGLCALDGCEEPLPAGARQYCTPAHSKLARDRRYRATAGGCHAPGKPSGHRDVDGPSDAEVTCPGCGTFLLGFTPGELCDECKEASVA